MNVYPVFARPLAALVLFTSFFLLTMGGQPRAVDERLILDQTESLVLRGELSVPQAVAAHRFYGRYSLSGDPYSPYGAGMSWLGAPSVWLSHQLFGSDRRIPAGMAIASVNALAVAGVVVLFLLVLESLGCGRLPSLLAAGMLATATPLWSYSGSLFSEGIGSFSVFSALAAGFLASRSQRPIRLWFLAGAGLGLGYVSRPAMILLTPLLLAPWLQMRPGQRWRSFAAAVLPLLAAGSWVLGWNYIRFGSPFQTAYPEIWDGKGINDFSAPMWRGVVALTVSPGKGVLWLCPPLLATVAMGKELPRGEPRRWAIAGWAGLVGTLLFYSRYEQHEGGFSFGPRYLVPVMAVALVPLGFVWRRACADWAVGRRRGGIGLALLWAVSAWLQLLGSATNIFAKASDRAAYYGPQHDYQLDYMPWVELSFRLVNGISMWPMDVSTATLRKYLNHWALHLSHDGIGAAPLVLFAILLALGVVGGLVVLIRWPDPGAHQAEATGSSDDGGRRRSQA